jgi:hypothetical protein
MFLLTLPADAPKTGPCRINRVEAIYKLSAARIEYRHKETDPWEVRFILSRRPNGSLIDYVCDDGPDSSGPYAIIGTDGVECFDRCEPNKN